MPQAIAVNGKDILVLDSQKGTLTVFHETVFGAVIKQADTLTIAGKYDEAMPLWAQVLGMDRNSQLAYRGMAKGYLLSGDYDNAIKSARLGLDQASYAQAFSGVRSEFFENNFVWIFFGTLLLAGAFTIFIIIAKRRQLVFVKNIRFKTMLGGTFHPFKTAQSIKYSDNGSLMLAAVVAVLFFISSIIVDLHGGFMYVIPDPDSFNAGFAFLGTVGVLLLWSITNWLVCMLFEGKGLLKHIFICSSYSLIPMIIYGFVYFALTFVMTPEEAGFVGIFHVICIILTAFTLLIGIMTVHDFDFYRAAGTTVLTIIGMGILIFIIFMLGILFQNLISFVNTIFFELSLN